MVHGSFARILTLWIFFLYGPFDFMVRFGLDPQASPSG